MDSAGTASEPATGAGTHKCGVLKWKDHGVYRGMGGGVSAVCQIWAGCQVSALICDCSVNFSYTAGPWQPRVCAHVRARAHQHLRTTWCWTLCVPVQKSLLQASCRLHATGRASSPPPLKVLRQKQHFPTGLFSRLHPLPGSFLGLRRVFPAVSLLLSWASSPFSPWCPGIIVVLTHILFSPS